MDGTRRVRGRVRPYQTRTRPPSARSDPVRSLKIYQTRISGSPGTAVPIKKTKKCKHDLTFTEKIPN
ncbi:hypothetical protein BRADI_1g24115v3 [Brachypodium distachyon]|uniref:Uncharacterized protein n=1 Tax=Brachypodium distachyon TaxID=15368 RepID=A0A0Q3GXI9_BRADI|nr:hypothetical protein BRADI_1g24115v3 [Brachypodium distachyon]